MKHCLSIFAILSFFTNANAFSLDSVSAINCKSVKPSQNLNVYLTTESTAAHKYLRETNEIPYEYGNKKSPFKAFSSGVLVLKNNPDREDGKVLLTDSWTPEATVILSLEPTSVAGNYRGSLTGAMEFRTGWSAVSNHRLKCKVVFKN